MVILLCLDLDGWKLMKKSLWLTYWSKFFFSRTKVYGSVKTAKDE